MAVTPTPAFPQAFINSVIQVTAADSLTVRTLVSAGNNGYRMSSINAHNTDAARDVTLYMGIGGVDYPMATIAVAASAGMIGTTPSINMLGQNYYWPSLPYDNCNNRYLDLASGTLLRVAVTTTVAASKAVTITTTGVTL